MAEASTVLSPAEQQQVAHVLEDDAEVMSNTQLEELLAGQPAATQAEIIRINTDARPLALQVALLIPILAGLLGLLNSFRMMRLPDPVHPAPPKAWPSADVASIEGLQPRALPGRSLEGSSRDHRGFATGEQPSGHGGDQWEPDEDDDEVDDGHAAERAEVAVVPGEEGGVGAEPCRGSLPAGRAHRRSPP